MKKSILSNPWLKLLPFLVLYLVLVVLKHSEQLVGDEGRYWSYAGELLKGGFALDGNDFLWSGPGYPLFVAVFRFLDAPLLLPKLFNALFLYLGLVLIYKTLSLYITKQKKAFFLTAILGLYYPSFMQALPSLLTEALAFLCVCAVAYFTCKGLKENKLKWLVLAGLSIGYLALVKVIFGYVMLLLGILFLAAFLFHKTKSKVIPFGKIIAFSFLFVSPYLLYTYSLTGKVFYWGNSGGMSLYWISSPYENDLGDWHSFNFKNHPQLGANHEAFVQSIDVLSPVERDEALKTKAIENITNNKKKFLNNWIANISRLFFSYPLSYLKPSTGMLYYLIPNMFLIVISCFSLFLSLIKIRSIPYEISFLLLFALVYLAGVSLLSSYARFLFPVVPLLLVWNAFVINKYIRVNI